MGGNLASYSTCATSSHHGSTAATRGKATKKRCVACVGYSEALGSGSRTATPTRNNFMISVGKPEMGAVAE
jgi:hypothetical protein